MNAMSNEDVKDTAIDVSNSPTTIPEEQLATEQEVIPLEDENSEIFVPTELVPEEVQKIVVITEKTEMVESPTMLAEDITCLLYTSLWRNGTISDNFSPAPDSHHRTFQNPSRLEYLPKHSGHGCFPSPSVPGEQHM